MSSWTYVNGVITVNPMGISQAHMRFILDTVLAHLPKVTGSNRDMEYYVVQKAGWNGSSTHDEFGQHSNLGNQKSYYRRYPAFEEQSEYLVVVDGSLRDREFKETFREFSKWINRLAKRVWIRNVLVEVSGYTERYVFTNRNDVYYKMFEEPSWSSENESGEPNWCEFMYWRMAKNSRYPMLLGYKYFQDEENDKEVERMMRYEKDEDE